MNKGYLHGYYAHSVKKNIQTIKLENSQGTLIKDKISTNALFEAYNCYPLLICQNYNSLIKDIININKNIISIYAVLDPFADFNLDVYNNFFDVFYKFKNHYIIDFNKDIAFSKHHCKEIKRALNKKIRVKLCHNPIDSFEDWNILYAQLIKKHQITNFSAFSKDLFTKQFNIPGLVVFKATINEETVGMAMWFISKNMAYYHLTAYSELGYKSAASYAIMNTSLNHFKNIGIAKVTLGGNAGFANKKTGLSDFKSGWANKILPAYFFGKINNLEEYNKLSKGMNNNSSYFPAYKAGK